MTTGVKIFKSTDTNAPTLNGSEISLVRLLRACLIDGIGGRATATLTTTGTNPSDGDQVTVGSRTYTFKTSLTPSADEVFIGANAATSLSNLAKAINLGSGSATKYAAATTVNTEVTAYDNMDAGTTLVIEAIAPGTGGNSLASTETSSQLSFGGSVFSGGAAVTTAGVGSWTFSYYSGCKISLRAGAANQFYLYVNDQGPGALTSGEARCRGYEAMTSAADTGTGPFPTTGQVTNGLVICKSSAASTTNRPWIIVADDRTFYLFTQPSGSSPWMGFMFGDFYSYLASDPYRTAIMGRIAENGQATASNETLDQIVKTNVMTAAINGHYAARSYTGLGGSVAVGKHGDSAKTGTTSTGGMLGVVPYPNPPDGGLYLSDVTIFETVNQIRGRMRGLWHQCCPVASFVDGDTFSGYGEFSGKSFLLLKSTVNSGIFCVETTDTWDTNS